VVEPERAAARDRPCAALVAQFDEVLIGAGDGKSSRDRVLLQDVQSEEVAVIRDRPVEIADLQTNRAKARLRGKPVSGRCDPVVAIAVRGFHQVILGVVAGGRVGPVGREEEWGKATRKWGICVICGYETSRDDTHERAGRRLAGRPGNS
jgi:hypothetical protein